MNRDEFVIFKNEITAQRSLLRLDCMNPFAAMRYLKKDFTAAARPSADVIALWAERMDMQTYQAQALASPGVRQTLRDLFGLFSSQKKDLWLPEDVYPFYWEAAQDQGLSIKSFPTLPTPDFTPLDQASENSVALITNPVSPLGRRMNTQEAGALKKWLGESKDRRVILDTVYSYTHGFDTETLGLLETNQCYVAHSLSKAWLERGVFGILVPPKQDRDTCKAILQTPPQEACNSAYVALDLQPEMPLIQQRDFSREWQKLTPAIRAFAPDFVAPDTGYFAAINAPYDKVLAQHNALVIPGSVFGSKKPEISVVSCLFDIAP